MSPNMVSVVDKVDGVFLFILGIALVMLLLITFLMIYFVIRYHKSRHPEPKEIPGNWKLETIWTIIPTIIVLMMFYFGWDTYLALRNVPPDAMLVNVTGEMYSWSYSYPGGKEAEHLVVPLGKPIKLNITSEDVTHSLFIPAYRIKVDAVTGMTTYAWFHPSKVGVYEVFCAEFCGDAHYDMTSDLIILSPADYEKWIAGEIDTDAARKLVQPKGEAAKVVSTDPLEKFRCLRCHSTDGSRKLGPSFKGLFGSKVEVVRGRKVETLEADEEYIKRSITNAEEEVRAGYNAMMKSYSLDQKDLDAMVERIKGLK